MSNHEPGQYYDYSDSPRMTYSNAPILDTDAALYEALGHLVQAEMLTGGVAAQDAETYALADTRSLLADAISQIKGEIAARHENRRVA